MSEVSSVGSKVDAVVAKLKSLDWLKKTVTIPVKLLVVAGVAVVVLAVALSLARRAEPQVSALLWNDPPTKTLDVATAAAAVQGLKEHISEVCKPVVVKAETKKVK